MAHMLRIRLDDNSPWSPAKAYDRKRERDDDERVSRCLLGIRTHSWTETREGEREREATEAVQELTT